MTTTERTYPDPTITMESEVYWAACNENKLLLKKCGDCSETHFYPRAICPNCLSDNTQWYEASGKGRIYSYSVMRRVPTPYAIAYVTLDEGVAMLTNIVDCDLDNLAVNQNVELTFRSSENDQKLPMFRTLKNEG